MNIYTHAGLACLCLYPSLLSALFLHKLRALLPTHQIVDIPRATWPDVIFFPNSAHSQDRSVGRWVLVRTLDILLGLCAVQLKASVKRISQCWPASPPEWPATSACVSSSQVPRVRMAPRWDSHLPPSATHFPPKATFKIWCHPVDTGNDVIDSYREYKWKKKYKQKMHCHK